MYHHQLIVKSLPLTSLFECLKGFLEAEHGGFLYAVDWWTFVNKELARVSKTPTPITSNWTQRQMSWPLAVGSFLCIAPKVTLEQNQLQV